MNELNFLSAHELAQGIRNSVGGSFASHSFSAVEVLDAHLKQIAKHNPSLNAIITLDEAGALKRAKEADEALARGEVWGKLHGVPITVKDYIATAGLRTTSSYPPLANYVPTEDATVVARLRAAGAIILGKTNQPKLAKGFQTDSPLFGRSNNPWNLDCTPGGSTGGGAAAVAAGLSPLEIGGDIGGSIRIPAHFCGIFGLKPTENRVSNVGVVGRNAGPGTVRHLRVIGLLARSIEDLRLGLSLIEGPDHRDWQVQATPRETVSQRPLKDYSFAWTDDFAGVPITADTRSTLEKLAIQLEELGCRVEHCSPPRLDFREALRTYGEIVGTELGVSEPRLLRSLIPLIKTGLSARLSNDPLTHGILQGARLNFRSYVEALNRRDVVIGQMEAFLSDWDAWLCPVTCGPAFEHVKVTGILDSFFKVLKMDDQTLPYNVWGLTHAPLFNLTGNPVVVIPAGQSQAGLPIGIQVVGKRWGDMELLAIAQKLAEVTGGFKRPPGY
ncbi:MAG TPA: amidase [Coleofasciculaceae cyanobacterium]